MSLAALGFAAGVVGAYGSLEKGKADKAAAKYNAAVARQNATLARQQAERDAQQVRVQGQKFLGDIQTSYAASGVTMEGSAYDVMAESAANIKMDEMNVKYQGELQANQLNAQARMDEWAGRVAQRGSYISAAGSLLGGASDYARYSQLSRTASNEKTSRTA